MRIGSFLRALITWLETRFMGWSQPAPCKLGMCVAVDLMRSKTQLVAENALLRQQLIILKRQTKRPKLTKSDRVILVVLASKVKAWREALLLVKPATLLGWHRQGFRLFWRFKSHVKSYTPRIAPDTVALIHQMALENRFGAHNVFAVNSANLEYTSASAPCRNICARCAVAISLVRVRSSGSPFCTIMPQVFGRATSCRFTPCFSAWCMSTSSLSCTRGELSSLG